MTNPKIEFDLADVLNKLDSKIDKLDGKIDHIQNEVSEIKGEIKAFNVKVDQLEKRIGNVEFASRGILIGIGVVILGGLAMVFGLGKH